MDIERIAVMYGYAWIHRPQSDSWQFLDLFFFQMKKYVFLAGVTNHCLGCSCLLYILDGCPNQRHQDVLIESSDSVDRSVLIHIHNVNR